MRMGARVRSAVNALRGQPMSFDEWMHISGNAFDAAGPSMAGPEVNAKTAMTLSAIFAAVNFYALTFAALPKVIYKKRADGKGRERAVDHPLYDRFKLKPNESEMTAFDLTYAQMAHKMLLGKFCTWVRGNTYQNRELIMLNPLKTFRDHENPNIYKTVFNGKTTEIPSWQIIEVPHVTLDGQRGRGILHFARDSLGISLSLEEFAGRFFKQGTHTGGIVELTGKSDVAERKRVEASFNEKYSGLGKSWRTVFLQNGKYHKDQSTPEQSQALESRKFSVEEAARWTNLPPHVLKDLSRATFSNIEHQGIELVTYSIMPIATQLEQAYDIGFFDAQERKDHYTKFELKGLLRGDMKTRSEFYRMMLDRGVYNADHVLELEDENPQPDGLGQMFTLPMNVVDKKDIRDGLSGSGSLMREKVLGSQERSSRLATTEPRDTSRYPVETRSSHATSGLNARRQLSSRYERKFEQFAESVVAEEVDAVRAKVKSKLRGDSLDAFLADIDSFYESFRDRVVSRAQPIIDSYAHDLLPLALEESGSEEEQEQIIESFESFESEYIDNVAKRHIDSSVGQIKALAEDLQNQGEDIADGVEGRLDEWSERRPGKIVMHELDRAENAFSRQTWILTGVTKLMSVAYGSDTCPYCNALDGKVVGIEEAFLDGTPFQPDGAEAPLQTNGPRRHAPYHDGCVCGIVPAR